jgi:hypothetical protein
MDQLTKADLIWNRACIGDGPNPLAGDRAFEAVLTFHSICMNGDILHAVESIEPKALACAVEGYRFFGFNDVADVIASAQATLEAGDVGDATEGMLDRSYGEIIPDDSALTQRFKDFLASYPSAFAPL